MTGRLWFDPVFGASGDMLLGALLGLGAPLEAIRADLDRLDVDDWSLERDETSRAGISATRALVTVEGDDHPHRAWSSIDGLLASASLPATVADGARRTFALLARVEAGIHRVAVDEVHFHEVGAVDALVDVVGVWSAVHHLGPVEVHAGPVGLGTGTVRAAHGLLPAPAPATLDLLSGIPVRPVETETETVTPTGAALLATLVDRWGPIPAGRIAASARGAGGRNPDTHPNVVGAVLVTDEPAGSSLRTDLDPSVEAVEAVVLATNLDDVTPEVIGQTLELLLEAGADDAWVVPAVMKKQRPGHELRVLADPGLAPTLRDLLFRHTGTLGIRTRTVTKHRLDRRIDVVPVRGGEVRVKVGPHGAKPEHDDLVALSRTSGVPVRLLAGEVLAAHSRSERDFCHNEQPD